MSCNFAPFLAYWHEQHADERRLFAGFCVTQVLKLIDSCDARPCILSLNTTCFDVLEPEDSRMEACHEGLESLPFSSASAPLSPGGIRKLHSTRMGGHVRVHP